MPGRPLESDFNFNLNHAENLVLEPLISDPTVMTEARLWYNLTEKVAKYWNGTSLVILTPGSGGGATGNTGATGSNVGVTGVTGPTGPTGNTGNSGATGPASTVTGNTGNTGPTGVTGLTGNSGATGVIGKTGNSGATGGTGLTGNSGTTGATGNIGNIGNTGNSGATGPASTVTGATGVTGPTGGTGLTGTSGATGNSGTTGATGNIGNIGNTGNSGATGPASTVTGATGVTGPTGGTGLAGNSGTTGATGNSGATGVIGKTGNSGATGGTGLTGLTGNSGATGSTGTPGAYTETQNTLLGRGATAGTGAPQEIALGSGLGLSGTTLNVSNPQPPNDITKDTTGFTDPENIVVTYNPAAQTVTLTGTVAAYYQGVLIPALVSGWTSAAHPNVTGHRYFLYYNGSGFVWGDNATWTFDMLQICFVSYGASDKWAIRECHGMMPWTVHRELHETVGTYRASGGTLGTYIANSTTVADRRPSLSTTTVRDEDLTTVIPLLATGAYTQVYLASGGAVNTFVTGAAEIVPVVGAVPNYVTSAGVQTALASNEYGAVWLVALPATAEAGSQAYRYLWVQGQTRSTSLATAQGWNFSDLNLGDLTSLASEYVAIAKVLIRVNAPATNWTIISVTNLTGTRSTSTASPGGLYLSAVVATAPITGSGTAADPLVMAAASGTVDGYISAGAQTFGGNKTFNGTVSMLSATATTGTSAPAGSFHTTNAVTTGLFTGNATINLYNDSATANNTALVGFYDSTGAVVAMFGAVITDHVAHSAGISLGTRSGGAYGERVYVSPAGDTTFYKNVAIATSYGLTSAYISSTYAGGTSSVNAANQLLLQNQGSGNSCFYAYGADASTNGYYNFWVTNSTNTTAVSALNLTAITATFSGTVSTPTDIRLTGGPGVANLQWMNGVNRRFQLYLAGAESTGNAGSQLDMYTYSDANAYIDNPMTVIRASGGAITFRRPITVTESITLAASKGLVIPSGVPTATINTLYQSGGSLYFNGAAVGGGGGAALPTMTGNGGTFLYTDGSVAAWGNVIKSLTVAHPSDTSSVMVSAVSGMAAQVSLVNNGHLRTMLNLLSDGSLTELKSWDGTGTELANVFEFSNVAGADVKFARPISSVVCNVEDDAHNPYGRSSEKMLFIYIPGSVANQKVDIRLGNRYIDGSLEVSISGGYDGISNVGRVTKVYSIGASSGGSIWQACSSRYTEALGEIPSNFALADITWDATNSTYRIQVVNRSSSPNRLFVRLRWMSDISVDLSAAVMGPVYTTDTTVFPKPSLLPSISSQSITYNSNGSVNVVTEVESGKTRTTTLSYNSDGSVNTVTVVFNGITRTETYTYVSGVMSGMSAVEI